MEQCESAAALLESVREQEVQFEQLTRALEEERRRVGLPATSPSALGHHLPHMQNGRLGDADIERLKLTDAYINGTQYRMVDPAHGTLDGNYTPEDDSQEAHSVFSEEGTGRQTDNGMRKPVSRSVMPSEAMSMDGGPAGPGMGGYSATLDRPYRPHGPDYPTTTVPRNLHYFTPVDDYRGGPPSEAYTSLSRGSHMDERYRPVDGYRTLDSGFRAPSRQLMDMYGAQPQVPRAIRGSAVDMRYAQGIYGQDDDQRSVAYSDYGIATQAMHPAGYSTMPRFGALGVGVERNRRRSCEDTLDSDMGAGDPYGWSPSMAMERGGSMASLDSTSRKPAHHQWRQPELPEVIAMLSFPVESVKSNAAAFLQHLTYKNEKVKSDVRRLKGIPALVRLLDDPDGHVHQSACGALKNISFGTDHDNKIAIKNCDGVSGLVKLLRRTRHQGLTEIITGTLWNLSSHDGVKMEIVDTALNTLADEVLVSHSGWQRGSLGGEESCKPRLLEWQTALTNTAGCLRNVSSERSEARRKLRECTGLVDSVMYIVQSQINCNEVDNKLVENCVCLLRNLSFHVHHEVPGWERYVETPTVNQSLPSAKKGGCFGSRKGNDEWFSKGKKDGDDDDSSADQIDSPPKRTHPPEGHELLYEPVKEVVRVYTSLLKESKNPAVLEAVAGAIQNLCAGHWSYGRYIRARFRRENGLSLMIELLIHKQDSVVRAMSGALRNLAIDNRNRELLGLHAVPNLVAKLPGPPSPPPRDPDHEDNLPRGQKQRAREEEKKTIVSILSTLHDVLKDNVEAAKTLRASQGIERLVLITKDGKYSDAEVRAASQVLQQVWKLKDLRRPLVKDGWKKSDFVVIPKTSNGPSARTNGTQEDSATKPLLQKEKKPVEIQMNDLGPEAYSTLDQRERQTLDDSSDTLKRRGYGGRKGSLPLLDSYDG